MDRRRISRANVDQENVVIYYPYKGFGDWDFMDALQQGIPGLSTQTRVAPFQVAPSKRPGTDWGSVITNSISAFFAARGPQVAAPQFQNQFPMTELILFGVLGVLLVVAIK